MTKSERLAIEAEFLRPTTILARIGDYVYRMDVTVEDGHVRVSRSTTPAQFKPIERATRKG